MNAHRSSCMPGFEGSAAYGFEVVANWNGVHFAAYNSFRYSCWTEETFGL